MPNSAPSTCGDQADLTAAAPRLDNCPIKAAIRAVQLTQGQDTRLLWQMLDVAGNPVDLSTCGSFVPGNAATGRVVLRLDESTVQGGLCPPVEVVGTVSDPATGRVSFDLPASIADKAGMYLADIAVFSTSGQQTFNNQLFVVVNRGLFSTDNGSGIPTIPEIRLYLRDSDPINNPLLGDLQFSDAEIAHAISLPVMYFNETNPPIPQRYSTQTFPFRYHWLMGISAQLFRTASYFYARNHMPYSAGGVSVDDLNKAQEYTAIGERLWGEYRAWALQKKVELNARNAIGVVHSPYYWIY